MQPAHEAAQLLDRLLRLPVRRVDHLARLRWQVDQRDLGQAQVQRHRHQPLLRAVVQVPFDAPPFGIRGVHRAGAALGEVLDPLRQVLFPAAAERRGNHLALQAHEGGGQARDGGEHEQSRDAQVPHQRGVAEVLDPPLPGQRVHPRGAERRDHRGDQQPCHQRFEHAEQRPRQAVVPELPPPSRAGDRDPEQPPETPAMGRGERRPAQGDRCHREPQGHRRGGVASFGDVPDQAEHDEQQEPRDEVQRRPQREEGRVAGQAGERSPQPDLHGSTVGGRLGGVPGATPKTESGATDSRSPKPEG